MKGFALVVLFLVALGMVLVSTYRYWPSGKAQDYFFIWMKGDQIIQLFELADSNGYRKVFVCPDRPSDTVILKSGERLLNPDENVLFKQFSDAVAQSDLTCFLGNMRNGTWFISGSQDLKITKNNNTKVRHDVYRSYFNVKEKPDLNCIEKTNEELTYKVCTNQIFGNWYLREETVSMPFQEYFE